MSPPSVFITRGLTFVPGVRVDWRGCRQMPILTVFCPPLRCCSFVLSLVTTVYSRVLLSAGVGAGQRHNTGRHSSTYLALVQNTFCYVQLFDSGLSKSFWGRKEGDQCVFAVKKVDHHNHMAISFLVKGHFTLHCTYKLHEEMHSGADTDLDLEPMA